MAKALYFFPPEDKGKRKTIVYLQAEKRLPFTPEEEVRQETYRRLVYEFGFPPTHIGIEVAVQGTSRRADLVVYAEETQQTPLLLVECKRRERKTLRHALTQAYTYAYPLSARYTWATNGKKDEFEEIDYSQQPPKRRKIRRAPRFSETQNKWKYFFRLLVLRVKEKLSH